MYYKTYIKVCNIKYVTHMYNIQVLKVHWNNKLYTPNLHYIL
jgi:hypothetical protein